MQLVAEFVLVAADPVDGHSAESIRLQHRVGLLARRGGGLLVAPWGREGPVLLPGIRHVNPHLPPGMGQEAKVHQLSDVLSAQLDASRYRIAHVMGIQLAIPAVIRRRRGLKVLVEPGATPAQRFRDLLDDVRAPQIEELVAIESKTLARADAVIARSTVDAATLGKRGVEIDRLWTVPDGLPVVDGITSTPDLPHIAYVFGGTSRTGINTVLEAMARLPGAWRLSVMRADEGPIGAGETYAKQLKIGHRVSWGRLDDTGPGRIAGAQIVVCAPQLGRVVEAGGWVPDAALWALAAGRALVAPELPAVRAVAGGAARYYDPDDPGALAKAVNGLLVEPDAREALVAAARNRAEQFTWEQADAVLSDLWDHFRDDL